MKVWSVRLGLGFGEKKVLIHPIKVYWAPLMKDWRIFIQPNKDSARKYILFFSSILVHICWAAVPVSEGAVSNQKKILTEI